MFRTLFALVTFLLCTTLAFSYTVVLKNGKRIGGQVVWEDESQIRIKDPDGVEITIRKSTIDAEATARWNERSVSSESITKEKRFSEITLRSKGIAEIARESRVRRTGKSQVFRKEDLKDLPEITVLGTEEDHSDAESEEFMKQIEEAEESWKAAALEIYNRLQSAKDRYEALRKECDQLSLAAGFAVDQMVQADAQFGSPVIAQAADTCARMKEAEAEMTAIQQEFELLEEEARRKGIPPGWVDPLRF